MFLQQLRDHLLEERERILAPILLQQYSNYGEKKNHPQFTLKIYIYQVQIFYAEPEAMTYSTTVPAVCFHRSRLLDWLLN